MSFKCIFNGFSMPVFAIWTSKYQMHISQCEDIIIFRASKYLMNANELTLKANHLLIISHFYCQIGSTRTR